MTKREVHRKHFYVDSVWWVSSEWILLGVELGFCHGIPFLISKMAYKLWLFKWVFGGHFLGHEQKWGCHFKKNWQYLLAIILALSSENYNFGKFVSATVSLTVLNTLILFWCDWWWYSRIWHFWYYKIKCVNIWKVCIIQCTNIF